jgi:ABC-type transporter Mla MlaB component
VIKSPLRISVVHGDRWVVYLSGDIDLSARPQLQSIAEVLAFQEGDVDFDLAGVAFIDTAGWAAVQEAARATPGRLLNPSAPVRHLTATMARTRTSKRRLPAA